MPLPQDHRIGQHPASGDTVAMLVLRTDAMGLQEHR
jgi:hypothetical protein